VKADAEGGDGRVVERTANRSEVLLPDDVRAAVERARATQLEAIRLAHDATRQWRAVARQIADAGLGVHEAARLMGVSPSRVRDLLDP
jgi:SLT domain-containing protein